MQAATTHSQGVQRRNRYDKSALEPGTDDYAIWQDVYECDEYRLPDLSGATVLDVGGHVGSFAAKCIDRGAKAVISVEPNPRNQVAYRKLLRDQLKSERAALLPVACFHKAGSATLYRCPTHGAHSGDSLVLHGGKGLRVAAVTLNDLIKQHQPDVVKLDCEGAEWELLRHTTFPQHVRLVYVEFHEPHRFGDQYQADVNRAFTGFCYQVLKKNDMYLLHRFVREWEGIA